MNNIKKVLLFMREVIEIYIPVISFCIMFVVFIVQVFSRYVLRQPIPWAYEVTVTCYLWMVMLGAVFAQREKAHVRFTLVYDKLSIKGKAICSFLGNLIIAIAFTASLVPSAKFINFMKIEKTSILRVGLNIVYAPYIVFHIFILAYIVIDMYKEFMVFTGLGGKKAEEELLNETRPQYQEVIDSNL
ncbi:TRAP transporter small permease [Natronincola ferrireducens]|uniref:TRAP-type C4-dicarboxylate transport system, small permease component n=1 Tax=Natronincola ferrireducens TaxID=393762 RepID=A0A1G9GII6_9FIRM|nr:TRAP transporter small permease [Natronincola ferrireducens]SDL00494.1 TRAP-type C4-dicarboxylate transport system, small permease component [Natronincola ferrireducens]